MENQQTPRKTPSKFSGMISREIRDVVNRKNQMQGSPFCNLPNQTTPPSRVFKIKNPFEAGLNENLHQHIFSPSVFAEAEKPQNSVKFKWTIEDVSTLKPAHIDETTIAQFEQTNTDNDVHVQAKIEQYFSKTHIVPSPWNPESKQAPLLPTMESPSGALPMEEPQVKETNNVWTQTELTLPTTLSKELERILRPFFTFTEDQRRQTVDLNSSLCRRLFDFQSSPASPESSVASVPSDLSECGSPNLSFSNRSIRNFDSRRDSNLIPGEISPIHNSTPRKLHDCAISPICNMSSEDLQFRAAAVNNSDEDQPPLSPILFSRRFRNQSFAKMDFSGHMSVDHSFNMAPENDGVLEQDQTNFSESPLRRNEFTENSCNWDIEYNNISLSARPTRRSLFEPKPPTTELMDISNLTTPKSTTNNSQRKKLSDSFKCFKCNKSLSNGPLTDVCCHDNSNSQMAKLRRYNICDKYNDENAVGTSSSSNTSEDFLSQNTHDTGYNTCPELSNKIVNSKTDMTDSDNEDRDSFNQNIFASTPTKRNFDQIDK